MVPKMLAIETWWVWGDTETGTRPAPDRGGPPRPASTPVRFKEPAVPGSPYQRLIHWGIRSADTQPPFMKPPLLVAAKLARPRVGRILSRHRLLEALDTGVRSHPVTLVRAGAGYGKTTLLASYADSYEEGVVWYSLGSEDADAGVFLWHLLGALQLQSRRYGRSLRTVLLEAESARGYGNAAAAFLNDLSRIKKPLLVVLDDFHLVSDSVPVIRFLSAVLENMDTPVRFVIASRSEPPLPLSRLRARRQLAEIDSGDLAFSRDELRTLLEDIYDRKLSEQTVDLVSRTTEGWVTAVQLVMALDSGRSGIELPTALRGATRAGSAIHDYLAEEILSLQGEEDRRWMLTTSIFEEMEPEMLSEVLGGEDSETRIDRLVRKSLIQPFDIPQGRIYRYHALLRDFLLRRFRAEVPAERRRELHRAAAREFVARDNLVSAARQLALSGDSAELARFLRDHSLRMLDQGHYQALLSWFEELPSSLLDDEPWLRLRLGDVRHFLGDWPGAELEYERAQTGFQTREESLGESWAILGLLRIWNLRGDSERVVHEGHKVLESLQRLKGKRPTDILIRLHQVVSGAHFYQGQYADALALLGRLERLIRGNPDRQAALWNNRGVVWASQGSYQKAARAFERGLERPGARRSPRSSLHLCNLALLLNEMGDTERAQMLFREAMERAQLYQNRSQMVSCQIGLAHLYYRMGSTEKCLDLIRDTETTNADLKIPLVESDTLALRARILCDNGQYGAARTALTQALASYGASGRDANWLSYRIQAAVVDLRAGRIKEAYRALMDLHPLALDLEALFPRTTLLFHLGEAEQRLGMEGAMDHLADALAMGREFGYDAFFRDQLRRSFDPFQFMLVHGEGAEYIRDLAIGAGPAMEADMLRLIGDPQLPAASARAVLAMLAEIGGPTSHARLDESAWKEEPGLRTAILEALREIALRHPDIQPRIEAEAGGLHLRTLGRMSVSTPAGEVPRNRWKSQRALSIFVYLALRRGRGITKDRLIELFWPGKTAAAGERNIHPTLTYMRNALKDAVDGPLLNVIDGVYELHPNVSVTVDARRFENAVNEAKTLKAPREKLAALQQALAMYRGDFLADSYEPWVEDLRAGFAGTYENALEQTALLYSELENHEKALDTYQKLLQRNPFREEIHTRLMMCYHYMGDRRSLKQQYQSLRRILREELEVEPLPETASLYETLMVST